MSERSGLVAAFDTAAEMAGVALFEGGELLAEMTWRTKQNHSKELLPTLDWLLAHRGHVKQDLTGVVVCLGPGSYAGLRVGISTAKALAYGFGLPIVGIGRLAADAYIPAMLSGGRAIALQVAGRAELAWAAYRYENGALVELNEPGLVPAGDLADLIQPGDLVSGEVEKLNDETKAALLARGARLVASPVSRVVSLARLGQQRLDAGAFDIADTLVPLYLRAPAIGPQH